MARQWHRPGAFALALTFIGVALFVLLGVWQVKRAHAKEALFAAFAAAATQAPVSLEQARRENDPRRYPTVHVAGRYDVAHAYVLDNQVRDGRAGVMLFDVFEPADGGPPLLANRGFLPRDAHGNRPTIPPPPAGEQSFTAIYAPPPGVGIKLGGNALAAQHTWPKLGIYVDVDDISADLGRRIDPRVLLLMPPSGDAFVREWKPAVFPPERHLAYAFTWFMFAVVAVIIFVALHWRKGDIRE